MMIMMVVVVVVVILRRTVWPTSQCSNQNAHPCKNTFSRPAVRVGTFLQMQVLDLRARTFAAQSSERVVGCPSDCIGKDDAFVWGCFFVAGSGCWFFARLNCFVSAWLPWYEAEHPTSLPNFADGFLFGLLFVSAHCFLAAGWWVCFCSLLNLQVHGFYFQIVFTCPHSSI